MKTPRSPLSHCSRFAFLPTDFFTSGETQIGGIGLTFMKATTFRIPLRVVFYKEQGSWIAHCLEFDLCGDGKAHKNALISLSKAINAQLKFSQKNGNRKNLFSPAPSESQAMFFSGKTTADGGMELKIEAVDDVVFEGQEYREYPGTRDRVRSTLMPA